MKHIMHSSIFISSYSFVYHVEQNDTVQPQFNVNGFLPISISSGLTGGIAEAPSPACFALTNVWGDASPSKTRLNASRDAPTKGRWVLISLSVTRFSFSGGN